MAGVKGGLAMACGIQKSLHRKQGCKEGGGLRIIGNVL